jgi:hypothetical protein
MRVAWDSLLAIGKAAGNRRGGGEHGAVAASARLSFRRKFDWRAERRVRLGFIKLASSVLMADPDIRSKDVAAVDDAIGCNDE